MAGIWVNLVLSSKLLEHLIKFNYDTKLCKTL